MRNLVSSSEHRTIVAATDLVTEPDEALRAAAALAELTSAELHVLHVVEAAEAGSESVRKHEQVLDGLIERSVPAHFSTAAQVVRRGDGAAEAIRRYATEVSADLIVLGPHRESPGRSLGTTADRLIQTAGAPCLILRGPLELPLRNAAVLTDFSPAARAAMEVARGWVRAFAGGGGDAAQGRLILAHLMRPGSDSEEDAQRVAKELERAWRRLEADPGAAAGPRPEVDVLRGADAPAAVAAWAEEQSLDLLVLGTHGSSRLPYSYIGGFASSVTRAAPCPILLVPPLYQPRQPAPIDGVPRLDRVVTAVDLHTESWEAALWAMRYFAPSAEHELLHVLERSRVAAPLRAIGVDREREPAKAAERRLAELRELAPATSVGLHVREGRPEVQISRFADEVGADLVILGPHGPRRGITALLGITAERVLIGSSMPVLVARNVADAQPSHIVAAVDASEMSGAVLSWTAELAERFAARVTLMHIVDRQLLMAGEEEIPEADDFQRTVEESVAGMEHWLIERAHGAHLPDSMTKVKVMAGDPAYEIISEAARTKADLIVIASRNGDVAWTPLMGRVVNRVVRSASGSVLVVRGGAGFEGDDQAEDHM